MILNGTDKVGEAKIYETAKEMRLSKENEVLRKSLSDVASVLDVSLGDTDPYFPEEFEDDEEYIKQEEPIFWAHQHICKTLQVTP